jgi:hypothetical protein
MNKASNHARIAINKNPAPRLHPCRRPAMPSFTLLTDMRLSRSGHQSNHRLALHFLTNESPLKTSKEKSRNSRLEQPLIALSTQDRHHAPGLSSRAARGYRLFG